MEEQALSGWASMNEFQTHTPGWPEPLRETASQEKGEWRGHHWETEHTSPLLIQKGGIANVIMKTPKQLLTKAQKPASELTILFTVGPEKSNK